MIADVITLIACLFAMYVGVLALWSIFKDSE